MFPSHRADPYASGQRALSRIYWPEHLCSSSLKSGLLIGWNIRSFTACIAAVVTNTTIEDLESRLASLSSSKDPSSKESRRLCGAPLSILGVCSVPSSSASPSSSNERRSDILLESEAVAGKKATANLWVTVSMEPSPPGKKPIGAIHPSLRSIYCCGYRYPDLSTEVIFYTQPDPGNMEYLSLIPLTIHLSADSRSVSGSPAREAVSLERIKTRSNMAKLFRNGAGQGVGSTAGSSPRGRPDAPSAPPVREEGLLAREAAREESEMQAARASLAPHSLTNSHPHHGSTSSSSSSISSFHHSSSSRAPVSSSSSTAPSSTSSTAATLLSHTTSHIASTFSFPSASSSNHHFPASSSPAPPAPFSYSSSTVPSSSQGTPYTFGNGGGSGRGRGGEGEEGKGSSHPGPSRRSSLNDRAALANENELILHQINAARRLEERMERSGIHLTGTDRPFSLIRATRRWIGHLLTGCGRGRRYSPTSPPPPPSLFTSIFRIPALICLTIALHVRAFAGLILWVIHLSVGHGNTASSLRSISTTAQQIDIRMRQICTWPYHFLRIREAHRRSDIHPQEYIRFYNDVWLLANDLIIGLAVGAFLIGNHQEMGDAVWDWVDQHTVVSMEELIVWLKGWPAGLKLNNDLDSFLGDMLLWLLHLWVVCITPLRSFTPSLILLIGCSGFMGASMVISLASDLLSALTLHMYWFYIAAARIFHLQLTVLYSLFNLFRGKKRNVLRHRIDACDYDLDQLLLGTVFFTLLTFLFPTTFVYYTTFALARVLVLMAHALAESLLTFLNHFPLFPVMLRIKDPQRLPGGVQLQVYSMDLVGQARGVGQAHSSGSGLLGCPWWGFWRQQASTRPASPSSSPPPPSIPSFNPTGRSTTASTSTAVSTSASTSTSISASTSASASATPPNASGQKRRARAATTWSSPAPPIIPPSPVGPSSVYAESYGAAGREWPEGPGEVGSRGVRRRRAQTYVGDHGRPSPSLSHGPNPGPAEVATPHVIYLRLQNKPTTFSAIFGDYTRLWGRAGAHYLGGGLAWRLVTGQIIRPLSDNHLKDVQDYGSWPSTQEYYHLIRRVLYLDPTA